MKIDINAQDELSLVVIGKSGSNTNISVRNEILYIKPGKDENIEIQMQWDLSKPYLVGNENNITHIRFSSVEKFWDKGKNDKENIQENSHDCRTTKPVWWKHSICGHKYKLSVPDRVQGEIDCELCKCLKDPGYSFLIVNWDETKNGALDYMPPVSEKLNWKCQVCKHEFEKSITQYHNFPSCSNCTKISIDNKNKERERLKAIKIKNQQEEIDRKKLLQKPKNKFYLSSFIERKIYYLMKCVFGDIVLNGHKISKTEIDIFIPTLKIAIEYDGVYWHKNKLGADIEKNKKLKVLDINILRIRESGLNKIELWDIIYDFDKADMNQLFGELMPIIKQNYPLDKNQINSINEFLSSDINQIVIPSKYLSIIPLEKSIGFKYPHLLKDWSFSLNEEADLFKLTKTAINARRKFLWKCNICHFEFNEGLDERVDFCECPNCKSFMCNPIDWKGVNIGESLKGEFKGISREKMYKKFREK